MILLILALVNEKTVVPLTIHYGTREEDQVFFVCLCCVCVWLAEGLMGGEEGVIQKERKGEFKFQFSDILSLTC